MAVPTGTVTFLFHRYRGLDMHVAGRPRRHAPGLKRHDAIVRGASGRTGDTSSLPVGTGSRPPSPGPMRRWRRKGDSQTSRGRRMPHVRVRMGSHMGEMAERDGDYFGTAINHTARLMAVGHDGQVLCSQVTASLVGNEVGLVDLGEQRLRDLQSSVHLFQVDAPGLAPAFPPLRSLDALPDEIFEVSEH